MKILLIFVSAFFVKWKIIKWSLLNINFQSVVLLSVANVYLEKGSNEKTTVISDRNMQ